MEWKITCPCWWRCWKNRDSLCVRRQRAQWGASFMKAFVPKCGIAFGKMGICSLITQMMEPVLNIQKKRTLNEITIDASATPERFFLCSGVPIARCPLMIDCFGEVCWDRLRGHSRQGQSLRHPKAGRPETTSGKNGNQIRQSHRINLLREEGAGWQNTRNF